MAKNQVTEADLSEYYEQWQRLQVVHQAKQARYEDEPATSIQEDAPAVGIMALPPLTTRF